MNHAGIVALLLLTITGSAKGQLILADNYDVVGNGDGFALGAGLNSGINPPETRLTGSLTGSATGLRYLATNPAKVPTAYTITNGKFQVAASAGSGRVTLSNDGLVPFDFGTALGATTATAANPVIYELSTRMANTESGIPRFSFGIGTVEADVTAWDFGIQLWRAVATSDFYTIQRRIDTASSGGGVDINAPLTTLGAGTYGTEVNFLLRITDAGSETTAFNSRVQLSLDGGNSFIYDTRTDASLPNGFRFDGPSRFLIWDMAGAGASTGFVTYDDLSVVIVPEPGTAILGLAGVLVAGSFRRVRDKVR